MDQSNELDRKECWHFCENRGKVCSENTTGDKFSSDNNLADFLSGLDYGHLNATEQQYYNNSIDRLSGATGTHECAGSAVPYNPEVWAEQAAVGSSSHIDDVGAYFYIINNSCHRKLYSDAAVGNLIPLKCGWGSTQAAYNRINVCKCRDPD